jgi:hypothetical protein
VIKPPEVYFGITRQHAEVGHKNIIIFTYKNHLDRLCRNGKHRTQHMRKLDTGDLWIDYAEMERFAT